MRYAWWVIVLGTGDAFGATTTTAQTAQVDVLCRSSDDPGTYRPDDDDDDDDCKDFVKIRTTSVPLTGRPDQEGSSIHEPPGLAVELEDGLGLAVRVDDGTYRIVVTRLPSDPDVAQIAVLDLDGDGRLEAVWVNHDRPSLLVWYGLDPDRARDGEDADAEITLRGPVVLGASSEGDALTVTTSRGTTVVTGRSGDLPHSID